MKSVVGSKDRKILTNSTATDSSHSIIHTAPVSRRAGPDFAKVINQGGQRNGLTPMVWGRKAFHFHDLRF